MHSDTMLLFIMQWALHLLYKLPRGYGGVAILWHKSIDSSVNITDDGGERIQCIEVTQDDNKPLLIVSVYMPTSGDSIRTLEYQDTIDQIYEILQKYQSHLIVIGGDLNENLSTKSVNERKGYLLDFINLSMRWINQN